MSMDEASDYRPKVTYRAKKPSVCPVCGHSFFKESLLTGGGRLNAGEVTETLHRLYKPSEKYGKIYPLIYNIIVCPDCFFACMTADFTALQPDHKEKLLELKQERIDFANKIAGKSVDFTKYRTLETGAAAYALAIWCYDFFTKKSVPVIKQAICSTRVAFLFEDLEAEKSGKYFSFFAELYYKKALFFYKRAIELNQSKEQIMETLKSYGPDIDKNYGYDGILYLVGILTYKYGNKTDPAHRKKELDEAKLYLAKLFGMGKTDYDKPKEILDKSRDFYELITKEVKEIEEGGG